MSRARGKRLSARGTWDLHYGPNMTPMVDVVMVILIFFMTSASILGPEWFLRSNLPVMRPAPAANPAEPPKEIRVEFSVTRDGSVTRVRGEGLEDAPIGSLRFRLEQLVRDNSNSKLSVLVRPDAAVPYQDLVTIHETCQKLGIEKVGMLDREPAQGPSPAPAPSPPK